MSKKLQAGKGKKGHSNEQVLPTEWLYLRVQLDIINCFAHLILHKKCLKFSSNVML